ncbi:hypothetical protein BC628DRAFT_40268 [Trametes gibbosa]|nr:hypothetical protein BC628DRAFT_40268 [Trametes gibbosa]
MIRRTYLQVVFGSAFTKTVRTIFVVLRSMCTQCPRCRPTVPSSISQMKPLSPSHSQRYRCPLARDVAGQAMISMSAFRSGSFPTAAPHVASALLKVVLSAVRQDKSMYTGLPPLGTAVHVRDLLVKIPPSGLHPATPLA